MNMIFNLVLMGEVGLLLDGDASHPLTDKTKVVS